MSRFRTVFLIVFCLVMAGAVGTASALTSAPEEENYVNDVIIPAKNAGTVTAEQLQFLDDYHQSIFDAGQANLRRDDGGGPDDGGYAWADQEEALVDFDWYDYDDLDGAQRLQASDDWNSGVLDFGFDFPWYGEEYGGVRACSNGWVTLDLNYASGTISLPQCPNGGQPNPAFCVNNYDLNPNDGGFMWYWTNEEDMAIVGWQAVPDYGAGGQRSTTFQCVFNADGSVLYQYDEAVGHNGNNSNVGWESPDAQLGMNISYRQGGFLADLGEQGDGEGKAIRISDLWIIDEDNPHIVVAPEGYDFGNMFVGDRAMAMEFEVTNLGGVDLTVDAVEVEGAGFAYMGDDEAVLASGESWTFAVEFDAEDVGEVEGMVTIFSDAVNAEGGETMIELTGNGVAPPDFSVAPGEIFEELFSGETAEHDVTLTNDGDAALGWEVDIEVTGEQMDIEQAGPRRDPVEATFAVFQDQGAWGWLRDVMVGRVEGAEIENFNNSGDIGEVNLNDFDAVVIAWNDQSDAWHQACQNNLEWFEEYVDGGGKLYIESGGNRVQAPTIPGGIPGVRGPESNGRVILGPDENLLCELAEWDVDDILRGSSFMHHYHTEDAMNEAVEEGRIDSYQVIVEGERNGQPAVIQFNIGRGGMLVGCIPVGHQYQNFNNENNWGANADAILNYVLTLGGSWIYAEPTEGEIAGGDEDMATIFLNAEGLYGGRYTADVMFNSFDPDNPDEIFGRLVEVTLDVTGVPLIEVSHEAIDFGEVFLGGNGMVDVVVSNVGTDNLTVTSLMVDGATYSVDELEEDVMVAPEEDWVFTVTFTPEESAEYEGIVTFECDANNIEDGMVEIPLVGRGVVSPDIAVNPMEVGTELFTGAVEMQAINIANDGDAQLDWWAEFFEDEEEGRDDFGDLIAQFAWEGAGVNSYKAGLAWDPDDELMWITGYNNRMIGAVDPANDFEQVVGWQSNEQGNPMGAGFLNGVLYNVPWSNQWAQRWDREGNYLGNLNLPHRPTAMTVSHDEEWLITISDNDWNIHAYEFVEDGDAVEQIWAINLRDIGVQGSPRSILWVDGHPDAPVWVHTRNEGVMQVALDGDGGGEVVQQFNPGGNNVQDWDGLGHDGENLWVGTYGEQNVRIYDDGIAEVNWFAFEPEEGSIGGGGETDVMVTFDATGLGDGVFTGDLVIFSNDPEDGEEGILVAVELVVNGTNDIEVDFDDDYVNEDGQFDWNLMHLNLFTGEQVYDMSVFISNDGVEGADLTVEGIEFTNNEFSAEPAEFALAAGEEQEVVVSFSSEEAANFNDEMLIFSDDPDEEEVVIAIHAHAYLPPVIVVSPNGIESELFTGEVEIVELEVSNDGDAPLRFTIESVILGGGERAAVRNPAGDAVALDAINAGDAARKVGPRRDDAGDQLGAFQGNNVANQYSSCVGWDPDNNWMWVSNYSNATVVAWSPDGNYENFEQGSALQGPGNCMDGTFANGMVYIGTWSNAQVGRWDAEGARIDNLQFPFSVYGLAADQEAGLLFAMNSNNQNIHVYEFDEDGGFGDEIGIISGNEHRAVRNNATAYGLEWVGEHADGQLWMTDAAAGNAYQILVDTDNWEVVEAFQSFAVGGIGQPYCAIAHDGTNMWASGYSAGDIRVYDDGAAEISWLSFAPDEGVVEGGDAMIIDVTLDATGLEEDVYEAVLVITSNDPAEDVVEVSVVLTVIAAPDMYVEGAGDVYDEENDVYDWNMRWGDQLFTGTSYDVTFTVENTGVLDLVVDEIVSDNELFMVDPEFIENIAPGESADVTVSFMRERGDGIDEPDFGTVSFFAEEVVAHPMIEVIVMAQAFEPPNIELALFDPDMGEVDANEDGELLVETDLFTGQTENWFATVVNTGQADLVFNVDVMALEDEEEGRDGLNRSGRRIDGAVGPRRDEPGDQLGAFQGNNAANQYCSPIGWDPDNEWMWVSNYSTQTVTAWMPDRDYENFEEGPSMQGPGNCMDGTFMNGFALIGNLGNAQVGKWDAEGARVGNFQFPHSVYGMGADEENQLLFAQESGNNYAIHVYEIVGDNELGDQIGVINNWLNFNGNQYAYGLEWVEEHAEGQLWMTHYQNGIANQILVDTDEWQAVENVQSFNIGNIGQPYHAVGHDGTNMWAGGYSAGDIRIYDDGVSEMPPWLTIYEGNLNDQEDMEEWVAVRGDYTVGPDDDPWLMTIHLDASGLVTDQYDANIMFYSNDPDYGEEEAAWIGVRLAVQGVPDIAVMPVEEYWDGDVENAPIDGQVEFSWAYEFDFDGEIVNELFSGGAYRLMPFIIVNAGTEDLACDGIDIVGDDAAAFSVEIEDFVLAPYEELPIWVTFEVDEGDNGEFSATILFISNDPDEEEFEVMVHAGGDRVAGGPVGVQSPPRIFVDPDVLNDIELVTGEVHEEGISVSNEGDGDAALRWWSDFEDLTEEGQRDRSVRSARRINADGPVALNAVNSVDAGSFALQNVPDTNDPIWLTDNRPTKSMREQHRSGPRRDELDIDGMMFACFNDRSTWGWVDEGMRQDPLLDNENFVSYRNANDWNDVDFEEYDAIAINAYNQGFNQQYQQNLERFEEYIANGGGAYYETGNTNANIRSPGGIYNDQNGGASNGSLLVSPDPGEDNYSRFAEICNQEQPDYWQEGEVIEGSSWLHSRYSHGQFEQGLEDGVFTWFQPIASLQNQPDQWGAVAYGFGSGTVLTVGHPSGHCWQWFNDEGMWGSIAAEIMYYLGTEGGANWFSWEAQEGLIEAGGNDDIIAVFNAEGLLGGDYWGELNFYSNDPVAGFDEEGNDARDAYVEIGMNVRGIAVIDVTPGGPEVDEEGNLLDPPVDWAVTDWGTAFVYEHEDAEQQGRNGFVAEPVMVMVENVGTEPLDVEGIDSENEMFWVNEQEFVLEPGESREIAVWFAPEEPGEYETNLIFITNDEREDFADGYPVHIMTVASYPPVIFVDTEEIDGDLNNGETDELAINVSNDADEGDNLIWWTEFVSNPENPFVDDEERDRSVRSARRIDGAIGPRRDDPGDQLGAFQGNNAQNVYCSAIGYDPDNEWMWVSNYNNQNVVAWSHDNNYEDFEQGPSLQGPGNTMDGTFMNGHVLIGTLGNAQVGIWDAEGQRVGNYQFNHNVYGMGADEENQLLFVMESGNNYGIHVYEVVDNELGDQIGLINNHLQFHQNVAQYGLEWVEEHADGQLWITNHQANSVSQIMVDTDEWQCTETIQTFGIGQIGQMYNAVGHDGTNLWAGGWSAADIRIYDDGVAEMPPWFVWEPQEGGINEEENESIEPGGSQDIIVVLNAGMMAAGRWEGELRFFSNDPMEPSPLERWDGDGYVMAEDDDFNDEVGPNEEDDQADAYVTVTLVVHGAPVWEFADEDGMVNPEEQRIVFPRTYVGDVTTYMLEASNIGTDALEVMDFAFDDDDIFFISDEFDPENGATIPPGESVMFTFEFAPQEPGEYNSEVEIMTNIDNNNDGSIFIEIGGSQGPAIAVTPPVMNVNLDGNDIEDGYEWNVYQEPVFDEDGMPVDEGGMDYALVITNIGEEGADDLHWDLSFEEIEMEEEGRDLNGRASRRLSVGSSASAQMDMVSDNVIASDDPGWSNGNIQVGNTVHRMAPMAGPRRDEPESIYAIFQDRAAWGGMLNQQVLDQVDGLQYEHFSSNDFEDFDIDEFDVLWVCHSEQPDAFNNAYNNNRERIEEWVDGGGAFYASTGTNQYNVVPIHPGGLRYTQGGSSNGSVAVSGDPDDDNYNYLAELMEWEEGTRLQGNSLFHVHYEQRDIDNLENSDWNQTIVTFENQDVPGIVAYSFGNGFCVVGGTTDGHQQANWGDPPNWGSAGEELCYYLDFLANAGPNWIDADIGNGSLASGEEAEVAITINAFELEPEMDYYANMVIESNDVQQNPFTVSVHLFTGQGGTEPPWEQFMDQAEANHSVIVSELTFEGEPADDWYVAAFDATGGADGNHCVGQWAQWVDGEDMGLILWQDDDETEFDEGYENGEALQFRLWDPFAEVEYMGGQITVDYVDGPRNWVRDELTIIASIDARGVSSIGIDFDEGWNLISINVAPGQEMYEDDEDGGPDIVKMMAQLADDPDDLRNTHHVTLMKNGRGRFYAPAHGFNGIAFWDVTQGYQVRVDQDIHGEWVGAPIAFDADIPLAEGWNMIAYFPNWDLSNRVEDRNDPDNPLNFYAIRSIVDAVQIMKNGGGAFAVPRIPFSNMPEMTKGQGYQIRVTEDVVLNYPEDEPQVAAVAPVVNRKESHWTDPMNSGENMSVLVSKVNGQMLSADAQIAAVSNDGAIVGVANVNELGQAGLAVWGDDKSTENTVEGLKDGEEFSLILWNGEVELDLSATVTLGKMTYEADEFTVVDVTVQAAVPGEFYLSQAYPNPFNNVTRLTFGLPEASDVSVNVFDVAGRLVATLVSGQQVAGHHTVVWNGRDAASGVYLIRMESASFTSTRKLMLVK